MQIDEAARCADLTPDTIRFYEKSGMLPPIARDARGWRCFSAADIHWLKTLSYLRATGMPLAEVKRFAASAHAPQPNTPDHQALRLAILRRHADRLATQREALDACERYLTHKIAIYSAALEDTDD